MNRKSKAIIAACMALGMVAAQFTATNKVFAQGTSIRICGTDRYQTAINVSKANWTSADYAILATGEQFPDALCAGPLSKAYNAPILLTSSKKLSSGVLDELKRLKVKTVFIVGGTGAVSADIENSIKASNITVSRLAGIDRYATSKAIADQLKGKLGTVTQAAVTYGLNFPDALSIAAVAADEGMPILLTDKNSLPSPTSQFIKNNKISNCYVVGGTGVISESVKKLLPNPVRLAGSDRFQTNLQVMKYFESKLDFTKVYLMVGAGPKGNEFADALTGSAAAALTSSPVVLTYNTLEKSVSDYLCIKLGTNTTVIVLGGSTVVPQSIVDQLVAFTNNTMIKSIVLKANSSDEGVSANIVDPADNGKGGSITFDITGSGETCFTTGSAVLATDLASAKIVGTNINETITDIKKADQDKFVDRIFNAMIADGYNPDDGILASNVKALLNGATLTLTDTVGTVKTYTIIIK